MTVAARHRGTSLHSAWLALAAIAVMLRVLVPPGFMVGKPTDETPFALVLCTAQGMVTVPAEAPPSGDTDGVAADSAPCAFSATAQLATPPSVELIPQTFARVAPAAPDRAVHLAPGRGLAAPPPPARGPPILLI
ncbi:DUF2946 family protein [Phenylobacterium kunshanense]|uniref:DUF2946 domain-containing protein n=1 Tax=Phenylobacterium kunshanense TaxID=1445034 RepID=A0A328BL16_9CAUL|nr:DUF2946 family protein [Phenylobacterium kunshanense]RAK67657.1 hypothetical protein DJ019_07070 [Phenylobacterium kunshanense]